MTDDEQDAIWERREQLAIYDALGVLPGTAFRFEFKTKRFAIVPAVSLEQLRFRHRSEKESVPRWTHASPDGARDTCGTAHKDRDAKCPRVNQTWTLAPVNDLAHKALAHEEALERFAYVRPLLEGIRRVCRPLMYHGPNWHLSTAEEREGVCFLTESSGVVQRWDGHSKQKRVAKPCRACGSRTCGGRCP